MLSLAPLPTNLFQLVFLVSGFPFNLLLGTTPLPCEYIQWDKASLAVQNMLSLLL